jgi:tetratricopeptide (TPR) repeat protein
MRNAIVWSYDLLIDDEQALMRQLAVFVGGFSLEAAEAVSGDATLGDQTCFLDLIASLVDKSLLRQVEELNGEPRFRMLETIREFALERLDTSCEADTFRDRHAAWCLEFSKSADVGLEGPNMFPWLLRVEAEHATVRTAINWLKDKGETGSALRLGAGLSAFWWYRGHFGEGRAQLGALLDLPGVEEHPYALARAKTGLGALFYKGGFDIPGAIELHDQAIAIWRELKIPDRLAYGLWCQGLTLGGKDPDRAITVLAEALEIARELDSLWLEGPCLFTLGRIKRMQGDLEEADVILTDTLRMCREVGHPIGFPLTLAALGNVALDRGDIRRSASLLTEGLEHLNEIGLKWGTAGRLKGLAAVAAAPWGVPTCIEGAAGLAGIRGEAARAARIFGGAAALREMTGFHREPVEQPPNERQVSLTRKTLGEPAFAAAWAEGRLMTLDALMGEALAIVHKLQRPAKEPRGVITPLYQTG